MVKLNKGTKRAQGFINSYNRATATRLYQVYKSYSIDKAIAEEHCLKRMEEFNARDFRIMSANSFSFTCGYRTDSVLYIETSTNIYMIEL